MENKNINRQERNLIDLILESINDEALLKASAAPIDYSPVPH